jgi:alkanesulfonate monooxygenase
MPSPRTLRWAFETNSQRHRNHAMPVEFIGFITNNNSSETTVRSGPVLDPPYIETVAKAHELAGFDRALLAFHSTSPDCLQVASTCLASPGS